MNAYELADKLNEWYNFSHENMCNEAATMLRQQADRITELEKAPTKYCPSENNAAYEKGFIDGMAKQRDSAVQRMVEANTHPHKELSDEEIMKHSYLTSDNDPIAFAKAIIKASRGEK